MLNVELGIMSAQEDRHCDGAVTLIKLAAAGEVAPKQSEQFRLLRSYHTLRIAFDQGNRSIAMTIVFPGYVVDSKT